MIRRACLDWTDLAKWLHFCVTVWFSPIKLLKICHLAKFFKHLFCWKSRPKASLRPYSYRYKIAQFIKVRGNLKWKSRVGDGNFNTTLTFGFAYDGTVHYLCIRKLKRKRALLRSNSPAIGFLRQDVKNRGRLFYRPFFFTDGALWLRKPIPSRCKKNLLRTSFYKQSPWAAN